MVVQRLWVGVVEEDRPLIFSASCYLVVGQQQSCRRSALIGPPKLILSYPVMAGGNCLRSKGSTNITASINEVSSGHGGCD